MTCVNNLEAKSPCLYASGMTVIGLVAAAVVAIGIITLLANQNIIAFKAFSMGTPLSLPVLILGSCVLGAIVWQAIHSCSKQRSPHLPSLLPPNTPVNTTVTPPVTLPNTVVTPSVTPTGAASATGAGDASYIVRRARSDSSIP